MFMENLKIAYYTFNLYQYEVVLSPPHNLPNGITTFYITDNDDTEYEAINNGWNNVIKFTDFVGETDSFKMRVNISYIKSFFYKIVPELSDYDLVFMCDSNVQTLFDGWFDFYNDSLNNVENFVLSAPSGYDGENADLRFELLQSQQGRWSYNLDSMNARVNWYIEQLNERNLYNRVMSAKYMVWSPKHNDFEFIKDLFYDESQIHIQGNIILGYLQAIHPDKVRSFYTNKNQNGEVSTHKGTNR